MFCHPAEVEGYSRSAMAHSLRRTAQEPEGTLSAHGSTITMHSSPTGYWQHWENGGDSSDYRVDYVVGSGNHASGYLIDIGGHLFQSRWPSMPAANPMTWRPATKMCPIPISRVRSAKNVFSAIREPRCTSRAL
jgi:hypothetical protein